MKEKEQITIFNRWLNDHRALIFKVIRVYAFEQEDIEDLFQEITLQIWQSIPRFQGKSSETTWIYRISLNTAIKWIKLESRRKNDDSYIQFAADTQMESGEDERVSWLYKQISTLNKVDRSICLLLLDGFSYREMADIVGVSESNLAVKIHRIKKYLTGQSKAFENHGI